MALFVIADLHLSLSVNKPMDIFGSNWENHTEKIRENWQKIVTEDDVVVIPGDVSWAINFEEAFADFDFINKLNGKKIILKGNHDYWWNTKAKMNRFLDENGFDTISIVHNDHFAYGKFGICGSRGWVNEDGNEADAKVLAREAARLELSIKSAVDAGLEPIVFLHYPPIYGNSCNYYILDVLYKYGIKRCYYGHLHGFAHRYAICGERDEIQFELVSCDFIQFTPKMVEEFV